MEIGIFWSWKVMEKSWNLVSRFLWEPCFNLFLQKKGELLPVTPRSADMHSFIFSQCFCTLKQAEKCRKMQEMLPLSTYIFKNPPRWPGAPAVHPGARSWRASRTPPLSKSWRKPCRSLDLDCRPSGDLGTRTSTEPRSGTG